MQGLPIQQLQKSAQGPAKAQGKTQALAENKIAAKSGEGANIESANGDFSSLFASMTGVQGKASEVKSEPGEILKNLLTEKDGEKNGETKDGESKVAIDPKLVQLQNTETKAEGKVLNLKGETKVETKVDQQLAKTNSSLDQLLNNLKGTQDDEPVEGEENAMSGLRNKNGKPLKNESKNESPLDFLMKGAKAKGVTENTSAESVKTDAAFDQKKVMTGEDFLKNMQAAEKKPALALLNGQKGEEASLSKMMNANAKTYGQGMGLMNDSLIRNTKDLANKDVKKGKQNIQGIDELQTKDTKAGAELASLRQEAIPTLQNNKENHGQSQLQTGANQKVLDLSHVNTSNTTEIIKKISDYVEQNNVAGKQSLDLTVKHESLGEFKIQVSKMPESMNRGQNLLDMQITTSSKEGHDFFVRNEVSLMKNLNQAGVNLSDLRIVSSMSESTPFGQSDSRQSSSFQQNSDGSKQSMSFESSSFSSDKGAERRKELWEEYQQRYGA